MRKLMLELDSLTVESFDAGRAAEPRGTAREHAAALTQLCSAMDLCPSRLCTRIC
ncbi:MAG TPA: hypothetical protein VFQ39_13340 [Longimicrobium sp.]|nr:hypothetical protein [Longimicrobium sp.]